MKRISLLGTAASALLFFCASHAAAQALPVPAPDVAYFNFNVIGSTITNSVNSSTATWFGDAGANTGAAGIVGFGSQTNDENGGNGQEHYRTALPLLNGAAGLTISLWFNHNVEENNNSTYNGLFMVRDAVSSFGGGSENWGVALEDNGAPRHIDWRLDGAAGTETDDIAGTAAWHHVVMTWDGTDQGDGFGEKALFFNGTELAREDAPIGTFTTSGTWRIGDDACCGSREFTGTMDELGVWKTALTATDVTNINMNGLNGIGLDLVVPPLLGDVDDDGDVDLDDYEDIRANLFRDFGMTAATRADGDLNTDGVVDFTDYREWKTEFDAGNNPPASLVPEPASLAMLMLGLFGLGSARRKS